MAEKKQDALQERISREEMESRLQSVGSMKHNSPLFFHGRLYQGEPTKPRVTWQSSKKPRSGYDTPDWLNATEFEDSERVLNEKIELLAQLIEMSNKTVVYSGAGISVAAGIGQAAATGRKPGGLKKKSRGGAAKQRKPKMGFGNKLAARPTLTHHALAALGKRGLLHSWVQQNHDGLPQKAGYPQHLINEIHGSWFDPSNPVVKYSGSLKDELFPLMENDAETADLVIVTGTSLSGLCADQVATETAERSLGGASLGSVIINLQQTPEDGQASLRLFAKSDDVMSRLCRRLGVEVIGAEEVAYAPFASLLPPDHCRRVLVPYDARGQRLRAGGGPRMWLDLSDGAHVKLTPGHNVQGARQPPYMHIGARRGSTAKNGRKAAPGHGRVVRRDDECCALMLNIEGANMRLGQWWLAAAEAGTVPSLPVVNLRPQMEGQAAQ